MKAIRCIIIFNALLASEGNCLVVKEWLRQNCSGWESMSVCNVAKYFGTLLGPHSGLSQWSKSLRKFRDIISTVNVLHLPAELAQGQHTSRALPTLAYIAQIVPPLENAKRIGMNAVMKSLHMCGNSLSYGAVCGLDGLGGPEFRDLVTYLNILLY